MKATDIGAVAQRSLATAAGAGMTTALKSSARAFRLHSPTAAAMSARWPCCILFWFDEGLRHRRHRAADPGCAMAHWGSAML